MEAAVELWSPKLQPGPFELAKAAEESSGQAEGNPLVLDRGMAHRPAAERGKLCRRGDPSHIWQQVPVNGCSRVTHGPLLVVLHSRCS